LASVVGGAYRHDRVFNCHGAALAQAGGVGVAAAMGPQAGDAGVVADGQDDLDDSGDGERAAVTQARADAARERDELREALNARAQVLEESRADLRGRAERAEQDLAAARAELSQLRGAGAGRADAPGRAQRGRQGRQPGGETSQ
jgi:hypothetical protein